MRLVVVVSVIQDDGVFVARVVNEILVSTICRNVGYGVCLLGALILNADVADGVWAVVSDDNFA